MSHNDQKDLVRAHLDAEAHQEVVVDTANKLQGLEFDLVIAWASPGRLAHLDGLASGMDMRI